MEKLIPNVIKSMAQGHTSLAVLRLGIQIKESGFSLCLESSRMPAHQNA